MLKHKAIQRRTNRLGYTILITNTMIAAPDVLKIYRDKDRVEKAFAHLKPHLEPFFSRSEEDTRESKQQDPCPRKERRTVQDSCYQRGEN